MIFLIRLFLCGKKDKLFSKQLKAGLMKRHDGRFIFAF